MEIAWILLRLLLSCTVFSVHGTPVPLPGLSPTQDSDLAPTAASPLYIDTAKPRLEQTANTQATDGEDFATASTTTTDRETIGEDDSSESWLAPVDSDDVPKRLLSPQTSTEDTTMSSLQDPPMLPAIGPLPKDGLESLWTEAARPSGADTVGPLSQDDATESTMSSESLPLIFDPLEDVSPEGALSDRTRPSEVSPPLPPDWTSLGQASGTELQEPIRSVMSEQGAGSEAGWDETGTGVAKTSNLEENSQSASPSLSSPPRHTTTATTATVTMAIQHQHHLKSRHGFDEMRSDEDLDEDEENSEESEESDEDLTEAPEASTPPPYSLIPPPPVWVQRNQGLMRSWVELIREKAGYVSGMLAPVGIGISGALLLVGALYSIRIMHRRRRNSFKHQRRKTRQQEQPREPSTSGQDQAMLLADSSEDEF